jgi:hypothetical protein
LSTRKSNNSLGATESVIKRFAICNKLNSTRIVTAEDIALQLALWELREIDAGEVHSWAEERFGMDDWESSHTK